MGVARPGEAPCFGCNGHNATCHATCQAYKDYCDVLQERRSKVKEYTLLNSMQPNSRDMTLSLRRLRKASRASIS